MFLYKRKKEKKRKEKKRKEKKTYRLTIHTQKKNALLENWGSYYFIHVLSVCNNEKVEQ
jgi:hypothetical protein